MKRESWKSLKLFSLFDGAEVTTRVRDLACLEVADIRVGRTLRRITLVTFIYLFFSVIQNKQKMNSKHFTLI